MAIRTTSEITDNFGNTIPEGTLLHPGKELHNPKGYDVVIAEIDYGDGTTKKTAIAKCKLRDNSKEEQREITEEEAEAHAKEEANELDEEEASDRIFKESESKELKPKTFDHEKINVLAQIYSDFLGVYAVSARAEARYKTLNSLKEDDKYSNPFYAGRNLDSIVRDAQKKMLNDLKDIFTSAYPNVPLESEDLNCLISRDKYGNRTGPRINFKSAILKLEAIERKADQLAMDYLEEQARELIPSKIKWRGWREARQPVLPSQIQKGRTITLESKGRDYSKHKATMNFSKWVAVIIYESKPSTAQSHTDAEFKSYQNGRLDAKFKGEPTAKKIAEALCDAWNITLPKGKEE